MHFFNGSFIFCIESIIKEPGDNGSFANFCCSHNHDFMFDVIRGRRGAIISRTISIQSDIDNVDWPPLNNGLSNETYIKNEK